jgi:hypothetical protein
MNETSERHVDLAVVEKYFEEGLDGVLTVEGEPPARLVIAATHDELAIRVPAAESVPDVTAFSNIRLDLQDDEGATWHQLSVRIDGNLAEVYSTLRGVLDRIQISKVPLSTAVESALDSLAEILSKRRGLSEDQQLGLAGELLAFVAFANVQDVSSALEAWMGPLGEEHDFALPGGDVEVKVTLGERRHHWISSLTQLIPTPGRKLYVLSIQLTPAGAGTGWSLPTLAESARKLNDSHASAVEARLDGMGYRMSDADLYVARWTMRSIPQFFLVDESFPVITQNALSQMVPSSNRIVDVRYRIDLSGLPPAQPLFPFDLPAEGAQ